MKKKLKILTEHEEHVEQYQKQYTYNWSPRRSRNNQAEKAKETIAKNSPNLANNINLQIQNAQ